MSAARVAVWCTSRNGLLCMSGDFSLSIPSTLYIFVISRLSSISGGGRIPAIHFAVMDFPLPGGPIMRMLWPPATAISAARFTFSCPRMSAKSGNASTGSSSSSSSVYFFDTCSPLSADTASPRFSTPITSMPLTNAPSAIFSAGTMQRDSPAAFAAMTMGRMPGTFLTFPSRLNSPTRRLFSVSSVNTCPKDIRLATAIGRSKDAPLFLRVAGDRLMTVRLGG